VNAPAQLRQPPSGSAVCISSCRVCPANEFHACHGILEGMNNPAAALLPVADHTIPARRVIFRQRDSHDLVPFICRGWAAAAVTLSDGSRQILSFLLPGDLVSASLLFGSAAHCMVEAITEVRYRSFRRDDLRAMLLAAPDPFTRLGRLWSEAHRRAHDLAVDLGRRTADERIARLILDLQDRLASRGLTEGQTMDFPLRQHHVADATGLTAVHVSKVLSEFRRGGLIEINDRSLTVLRPAEFQRIATMR
jgi:CRP/FNR family transcriptional regulator, anaerobic regulatory protein